LNKIMTLMTLNSITATYPGFQSLPKGVKQMLLVSESVFFDEARSTLKANQTAQQNHAQDDIMHVISPAATGFGPRTTVRAG
jgi:hypothetical protein